MTYYNDELSEFLVNGRRMMLTEEAAEKLQAQGNTVVAGEPDVPDPLPDGAADELLNCTCPGDGDTGAPLCPSCVLYFESLLEDD